MVKAEHRTPRPSPIVAATLAAKSGERRMPRQRVTDVQDLQFQTHFSSADVTVS